jgi:hypothetical protein
LVQFALKLEPQISARYEAGTLTLLRGPVGRARVAGTRRLQNPAIDKALGRICAAFTEDHNLRTGSQIASERDIVGFLVIHIRANEIGA